MSDREPREERGSAMVLTIFVLALLSAMGIVLLYVANADVKMNQAAHRAKRSFYIAEAGLEDARTQLAADNKASASPTSLDDELLAAAGSNGNINFDVTQLEPTYGSGGVVTGFTGNGDDVPLQPFTGFGGGWHAAYLTNDPVDVADGNFTNDTNDRVMITAIGAGLDRSVEVVQAIVERVSIPSLPATVTLLGPSPADFTGGSSGAKVYDGDDCDGVSGYSGVPGESVPVVGTVGTVQEAFVAIEMTTKGGTYNSGGYTGLATADDTSTADPIWTQTIDPLWRDCAYLQDLAQVVKSAADYVCTSTSPCTHWASSTITTVTFVEGDVDLSPGDRKGILWVTGQLHLHGNTNWEGPIYVVGEGDFLRDGGGSGHTWGGILLANISGPDGIYGNADDCTGPGPDPGMSPVTYHVDGAGNHDTIFCSGANNLAMTGLPLKVVDFRQR